MLSNLFFPLFSAKFGLFREKLCLLNVYLHSNSVSIKTTEFSIFKSFFKHLKIESFSPFMGKFDVSTWKSKFLRSDTTTVHVEPSFEVILLPIF